MQVKYKVFQRATGSWESLFDQVARFATEVGPRRLIGISHSEGRDGMFANGVVTVWYWDEEPERSA
jgi:hypothetical protein